MSNALEESGRWTVEMNYKELLSLDNGDFQVYSSWANEKHKLYHLSIEGYIGFEDINSFVILYQRYLDKLHGYILENKHEKTERGSWKLVYQQRGLEVCYESDHYWVFLDEYRAFQIWDLYYYLKDIIDELKRTNITKC